MLPPLLSLILLIFFSFLQLNQCDDILGCGGYVKSDFDINYSRVEIKLYTKQGSLKYHTDCAPHNGYYLMPVYDKGDYVLKIEPPPGWSFEPSSVSLHIDGTSDPCSLNKDINFVFKGFSVDGQVLSHNRKTGPAGIKLILKSSDGKILDETSSRESGYYTFSKLFPGKYVVEAQHPLWVFDKASEEIHVVENLKTQNKIVVVGYDVSGSVSSDGQPIQGVHFLLFSEDVQRVVRGCQADKVKGFSRTLKGEYLCYVTSNQDGKFTFPSLPPGSYKVVPFYKGEHIDFDVSPAELDFQVQEGSLYLGETFQVQGFSVSGWIGTRPKGKGIAGVEVFMDGELHGTSDARGIYHLENMRAGVYKLEMKKDLMLFDAVEMKINPNSPRLSDIYASKFSICGQVLIEEYPAGLDKLNRNILFKADGERFMVPASADGMFCHNVVSGKYELEIVVSEAEANFGLQFVPEKRSIEIRDEPVLDVNFKQFRAEVRGKVKCLHGCRDIALDLAPLSHDRPHLKASTAEDGSFEFEKCLPGNYILTLARDDWCFQSKTLKFTITNANVLNLELFQTGFQASVVLTHASSFKIKYPSGEFHTVELHDSKNVLCLPEKGVYEFIPVGCHFYKKDSFKFDTNNPVELVLSPTKHLVTGNIQSELNVTDIKVHMKKQSGGAEDVISLQETLDKKDGYYRYAFSFFAQPNSNVEIRATSKQLLFRPVTSLVKVGDDCLENAVEIIGRKGLFFNGSVVPAIEGVGIKVFIKETNQLFTETSTDSNGTFLIGPLENVNDYLVSAEIEGYTFTPLGEIGQFKAFKLASIVVEVVNEDNSALSGVLLSLSGGTDYRKNSVTQKDGRLSFSDLGPGQYFLRSMLKEFSFDPASKLIDIEEGTQIKIKIRGKRVAYSVYGSVTSLTGEAEVGISVEAVGSLDGSCSQYQEEAISEQGGAFRIRGLQPECKYVLRLKPGADVNQHIERATPKELQLKVTDGDINGVRLIVFRYYGQLDVSGNVVTSQEYLQTLKVRLYKEGTPDQIVSSVNLGQSSFFYLPSMPIDNKMYILQLESSLSTNAFSFEKSTQVFCANTSFYHFTFHFQPRVKSVEQEVTQGSILALPVAVIALFLAYNYSKLLPLLSHFFYSTSSLINTTKISTESTADVRKKIKPKRIQ